MTYDPRYATTFRQRLLQYPAELENVDYKSSIKFGEDDEFTLKLIRHIFGMANVGAYG